MYMKIGGRSSTHTKPRCFWNASSANVRRGDWTSPEEAQTVGLEADTGIPTADSCLFQILYRGFLIP
jgi:hypothetical protein